MNSSLSLQCPLCGGQNAPDSRFCRHCGGSLESAPSASTVASEAAPDETALQAPVDSLEGAAAVPGGTGTASASEEIDARHARQLLERAHNLSDRGDMAGALLACRQSIALAPKVAGGHAMLGQLLERAGETSAAIAAYEKAGNKGAVLRLRDKTNANAGAALFHFNDNELFGGEDENIPTIAPVVTPTVVPAIVEEPDALPLPNIGAAAPGLPSAKPLSSATQAGALAAGASTPTPVTGLNAFSGFSTPKSQPAIAPVIVPPVAVPQAKRAPNWSALWARPSYFGRSLPLVGATIVALGFLNWAQKLALARATDASSSVVMAQADPAVLPAPGDAPPTSNPNGEAVPPLAPVGSPATSNGGFPISNQPVNTTPATNSGTANQGGNSSGTGGARINPSSNPPVRIAAAPSANRPTSNTGRSNRQEMPRFSRSIAPAPIPPAAIPPRGNRGGNSGDFTLPAPIISPPAPASAAPSSVLPSGDTSPLNPAGASGRGYVRITQGRVGSALPARPAGRAGADERAAADAARAGSTDRAIDGLTSAINSNSGDAGFRFQQRASLFLQRGDYSRAADDFQSAISAYNDQIARGDQVASARAGLRAARSGLNLALAGGR